MVPVCKLHTVNSNSFAFNLYALRIFSIHLSVEYALINVTSNPLTHSINMKIARRAWKQVRMGERRDFVNLPSKLSNYVNQEFSKCQRCWRG